MAEPIINDPTKELSYFAKRSGLFVAGKQSAEVLGTNIGDALQSVVSTENVNNFLSSFGVAIPGFGGLFTIGLAAGVSAGLTQMDYIHRKENLKDVYKEELSLKLHKPVNKLTRADLDEMAKTNATIEEELNRNRKQRNYGVGLSFIASMASLAVITLVLPEVLGAGALAGIGGFLIKAVVGLVTYHVVKDPLHYLADKMFGIDEKTTNDYIIAIKRDREAGKIISREQVLSVFVASNPELAQYIVAEYGKHFDDLSVPDKQKAAQEINQMIPLDRLTIEINSGKVNVSELAFAVEGQISGVNHQQSGPEEIAKPGRLVSMLAGVGSMIGMKPKETSSPQKVTIGAILQASTNAVEKSHHAEEANPMRHSHVAALEQSREQASFTQGLPS